MKTPSSGSRSARSCLAALLVLAAPAARAQQPVNPIHPLFAPLDAAGHPTTRSEDVSADATCGGCHDASYITTHSAHGDHRVGATCIQCHLDGGKLALSSELLENGKVRRNGIRIGTPRTSNCAACHGVVTGPGAGVALPADLELPTDAAPGRTYSLTRGEGAIVSPQHMSESFLNLADKSALTSPWDVHAAKLVDCVDCHYARNNPGRAESHRQSLHYLTSDPRRPTMAEFLLRPDHRLAEPDCRTCHDPMKAHEFLPYRARHMEVVACTACHVASPRGPAAEMLDETVAHRDGTPVVVYRNVEPRGGETLNAATIRPMRPLLVGRTCADGVKRLTPVNLVAHWRWTSRATGAAVPSELVTRAFVEDGRWAAPVLEALDTNRDGDLDDRELRLDAPAKTYAIAMRLGALGVVDPVVDGLLETHALVHGVGARDRAVRACETCHAPDSRLGEPFAVAAYLPGGKPPRPPDGGSKVELAGTIVPTPAGGLVFDRDDSAAPGGLHVLGYSRQASTNVVGFALFLAVFGGVSIHGLVRWLLARRKTAAAPVHHGPKKYVFGRYERLWHWTMALSGVALITTGLQVHYPTWSWPLSLPNAVGVHNAFAVVLMLNAFLSLFYHVTTAAIRNFVPHPRGLLQRIIEHVDYQSRGIFFGGPHPANAPGHKLNPLQQLTYLGLLNVLFPLQIATGLLIWAVGHWPSLGAPLSGLGVIAPVHNLGAWLFLTFFVLHVYLVTTGPTVMDHLKSMITGYQTALPEPSGAEEE